MKKLERSYKISGTRPYLFSAAIKGLKTPKTDAQLQECAVARVYQNNGFLFFPERQIRGVIKKGAGLLKLKLEGSHQRWIDYAKPTIKVTPDEIVFYSGTRQATMDDLQYIEYPVKAGPKQDKMVWTRSAVLPIPWVAEFTVALTIDALELPDVERALIIGGQLCAIGGKRPDYGLFDIVPVDNNKMEAKKHKKAE